MTPNKFFVFATVAGLAASLHAQGNIEAVNYPGGVYSPYVAGGFNNGTMGWAFSSSQNITVNDLGWLLGDFPPSSTEGISIGLWSADGTLLRSTIFDNNSVTTNGNLYEAIIPLLIPAGSTFIIGIGTTGNVSFGSPPPSFLQQTISFVGNAYLFGSGFTFPTVQPSGDSNMVFGATFLFQPVPEPSVLAVGALGALGAVLLGLGRKIG
jgi:hypothetical protein